jgi:hypothetical protein
LPSYTRKKPKAARPKRKRAARPSSGSHGGARVKAGRPLSGRGKLKQLREAEKLAVIGTPVDPKEFLKSVMGSELFDLSTRMAAACDLLPYYHPKLSKRELSGPDGGPVKVEMSATEMVRRIADLLRLS